MQARWFRPTLGQLVKPPAAWHALALPPEVVSGLRDLAARLKQQQQQRPATRYGPNPWRASQYLFAGNAAAQKVQAAALIARELDSGLWRVPVTPLVGRYIGETEKNIDRLFEQAAQVDMVLFFDEADALFGKRTDVSSAHDRYANIEISYLLQRAEAHRGVVLLSSASQPPGNEPLRRLEGVIEFP